MQAPIQTTIAPLNYLQGLMLWIVISSLYACGGSGSSSSDSQRQPIAGLETKALLGERLFSEMDLSLNRTQSCATCHNPSHAFVDNRLNTEGLIPAVSVGDDSVSIGDRNSPTITYAQFIPEFRFGSRSRFNSQQSDYSGFIGGQFHDGRAANLQVQAEAPPINPIEMALPDRASVVDRLLENPEYEQSFQALFGADVFTSVDGAYSALSESIAAFEQTHPLATFDSKYDRSLKGELFLTLKEALGRALFFSQTDTNCATCHQLRINSSQTETFTSFEYHNIGVPVNQSVRNQNAALLDDGLLLNPAVDDFNQRGKFKVPTLRNAAVTEPYMHNGVFRDLTTVIKFYDHFHSFSQFLVNPETGELWREPEIPDTVSLLELNDGDSLNQQEVEAIVCFIRTLTDARYEHLIQGKGIVCEDS